MRQFMALFIVMTFFQGGPLKPAVTIPLAGVEGRIDHLAVDVAARRLFVAALGNNTVEVVDLDQSKRVRTVTGLDEPQGIAYVPSLGQLFVANGGDGTVHVFDGNTLAQLATIKTSGDADNLRYDAATNTVIVGYGSGALGLIDAASHQLKGSIKLSGHPESFQLEAKRRRVYVNVPSAGHIAVVDPDRLTVSSTWPMNDVRANYPMSLDEGHHRLFVGTRSPPRLIVFDTETGKRLTALPCSGDTDDVFYDAQTGRVYVTAGEGFVDVVRQVDADHYEMQSKLSTAAGARTALFVPGLNRLFIAVPHRGTQQAAIFAMATNP
jgi:DNA-binding beta-propeller fold protein YncE